MNQPFRYDPANPTKFCDEKARYFSCERLTPEGFDTYVGTVFRGRRYCDMIPPHMIVALKTYIFEGAHLGNFLTALLCNDLMETMGRADDTNIMVVPWYCGILYNYMPRIMRGDREAINAWIELCHNAREEEAAEKEAEAEVNALRARQEEVERHTDYS